jgi:rubrerythrin
MADTSENLKAAFAGESQANRRYTAFANKAAAEGKPNVAALFRAVAAAETVHALAHLRVLGEVKSTAENLEAAKGGEHYEFTKMYPEFIDIAKQEGNRQATTSFDYANQVEQLHHQLYSRAAEAVAAGKDAEAGPWYVCSVCGNTVAGEPPDVCPVCSSPKRVFQLID